MTLATDLVDPYCLQRIPLVAGRLGGRWNWSMNRNRQSGTLSRGRWLNRASLFVVALACLAGVGAFALRGPSLPDGVISSTPLEYAVGDASIDRQHDAVIAISGSGNPLPRGHHLVMIDAHSGTRTHDIDLGAEMPSAVAVDTSINHALVVFSSSSMAQLIDTGIGRIIRKVALPMQPFDVAYNRDDGYAVASGMMGGRHVPLMLLIDLRSGHVVRRIALHAQGRAYGTGPVVFDAAARRMLVAASGGVNILDSRSANLITFVPISGGDPDKIVVDTQRHEAYVTLLNSPAPGCVTRSPYQLCTHTVGAYVVINDDSGKLVHPRIMLTHLAAIGAIGLSRRMRRLFVSDYALYKDALRNNDVYAVDTRTGTVMQSIQVSGHPSTIAVDDQHHRVIVGGPGGMDMIDMRSSAVVRSIPLPIEQVLGVDTAGDLVVSNDAYVTTTGHAALDRFVSAIRTLATNAGIYRRMNSGVSIVRLKSSSGS